MWQRIKNYYHFLQAFTAALYFGFPAKKLKVIGVTGTDGKTTTVHMIYHILKSSGRRVCQLSSIQAIIGSKHFDTGLHVTTPSPWQIQKYLSQAVALGSQFFVLEATSHGLDQNRLAFVDFSVAVLTNVSHEHLDYHGNLPNYLKAKSKLFKNVKYSILNVDDRSYKSLKSKASGKIISFSLRRRCDFSLKNYPISLKVPGDYNLANALAASAASSSLGINKRDILKSLLHFPGVLGRMEAIDLGQDYQVYIDFAHTPNGLQNALKSLRSLLAHRTSKLIAVFGSAGERDKSKRSLMGKVASALADKIVLTAEDPRSEDTQAICRQIAKGMSVAKKLNEDYFIIPNRKIAINFAIRLAQKGDIVATFGKSHEKSMCYGKKEFPWDEFKVVRGAVQKRQNVK